MNSEINHRIRALTAIIESNPLDVAALTERGRLHWQLQHTRLAINDYAVAAELQPDGHAAQLLDQAMAILAFRDTTRYNP